MQSLYWSVFNNIHHRQNNAACNPGPSAWLIIEELHLFYGLYPLNVQAFCSGHTLAIWPFELPASSLHPNPATPLFFSIVATDQSIYQPIYLYIHLGGISNCLIDWKFLRDQSWSYRSLTLCVCLCLCLSFIRYKLLTFHYFLLLAGHSCPLALKRPWHSSPAKQWPLAPSSRGNTAPHTELSAVSKPEIDFKKRRRNSNK